MSITIDQLFEQQSAGQADWDAGLGANISIAERGFHVSARAGTDLRSGAVVWINSGGYAFHYNPTSQAIEPHALTYTAASSGDSVNAILRGIVRSMGVFSHAVPGRALFVSAATPGAVVGSYSAAWPPIGFGLHGNGNIGGISFARGEALIPERLVRTGSTAAVTGSTHLISFDVGNYGWIREIYMVGNSADLVTLAFYSNSLRTSSFRLFETKSGGVFTVGGINSSFLDRAGVPYENVDASTLSGLIYGTLRVMSAAAVGSDTITVFLKADRSR